VVWFNPWPKTAATVKHLYDIKLAFASADIGKTFEAQTAGKHRKKSWVLSTTPANAPAGSETAGCCHESVVARCQQRIRIYAKAVKQASDMVAGNHFNSGL
jgi:hypothetical protein